MNREYWLSFLNQWRSILFNRRGSPITFVSHLFFGDLANWGGVQPSPPPLEMTVTRTNPSKDHIRFFRILHSHNLLPQITSALSCLEQKVGQERWRGGCLSLCILNGFPGYNHMSSFSSIAAFTFQSFRCRAWDCVGNVSFYLQPVSVNMFWPIFLVLFILLSF